MALSANLRGALFMALSMAGFVFNDGLIKTMTDEINIGQLMFIRGVMATLAIYLFARYRKMWAYLNVLKNPYIIVRIVCEAFATLFFLLGLTKLQFGNISAILQALPLAVTVGAAFYLKEPVGWRRWSAIFIGFSGVLIIIRPGFDGFNEYSLYVLGTVVFAAIRDIATRKVPVEVPSMFITTITSLSVTLMGLILIVPMGGWAPVTTVNFMMLMGAAFFILVGYHFIISSMRTGEISFIAPFRYTGLLWAMLIGYFAFNEIPDTWMIVGSSLIVATGLYTLHRERIVSKERLTAARSSPRHNT